jgi:hypothetical protein
MNFKAAAAAAISYRIGEFGLRHFAERPAKRGG